MKAYTGGGNYSTNEVFTGKYWIDGKKIFRKVVDFGALPNNATKSVNTNISNGAELIDYSCLGKTPSGVYLKIPYASLNGLQDQIHCNVSLQTVTITTGVDRSTSTARATLEYTKTTD